MIWLRHYLSLMVPLVALLVGIESILLINRALDSNEQLVSKSYAIVLVSNTKLSIESLKEKIPESLYLKELDSSSILKEINDSFSTPIFGELKDKLPYFYSLKLSTFPNQLRIKTIQKEISKIADIIRVESFSKSHNQIYKILVLMKGSIITLCFLIFILSVLLMIKQVEVWLFEHSERMEIMTYLGAPSKFKNGPLYKLALIDSIISSLIVMAFVVFISKNPKIISIMTFLDIDLFNLTSLIMDFGILLFSAYCISIISVFMVIIFQKEP